ncbi:MAG: NADH-quinone oxidoreductase subunit J [Alphaproteobacteria bacterium]|nr:NADH-quinone oxidoreductase subunit J [Alphaproteobacteria bacterium]
MNITAILFYIFSGTLLSAAALVITSRNAVHGALFLIVAFFNAAGLFVLAQAEFLAMMLIVVYVGAVAVLFLFVVMMLNLEMRQGQKVTHRYSLIGGVVGGVLMTELLLMLVSWRTSSSAFDLTVAHISLYKDMTNTQALGNLLYTHYALIFQCAGLILLISMIGAIVLSLRHREGVRRQKIGDQIERQMKDSVQLMDIPSGSGI